MMKLFQIAFYSACVSCGLAVMRNTKLKLLSYIFPSAFCAAFAFNFLNGMGYTFSAGVAGGLIAAVFIGLTHRKGAHGYLFIVIPVIYCMGPGGAMYKMFLGALNFQWNAVLTQLVYIIKDAVGLWAGIVIGTKLMNTVTKIKSEEF